MLTIDLGEAPALTPHWLKVRRTFDRTLALCALLVIVGVARSAFAAHQPAALSSDVEARPAEKKFTIMPIRFGVNPSVTTSGASITMSPDIAVEGGFVGWEESYGSDDYEDANVVGPGDVGESGASVQGQALTVNDKPMSETAAIVGKSVAATASAVDHAAAATMINTWEAPGRVVGAEWWAAGAAAQLANGLTQQALGLNPHNPPMVMVPPAGPAPPNAPPTPPSAPPNAPPPEAPAGGWWG